MTQASNIPLLPTDLVSEMHGRVLVLTINRPRTYNAWTEALRAEFTRRMHLADKDENVDAVVITGSGDKAFCAGQDLNETEQKPGDGHVEAVLQRFVACYDSLRWFGKPVVAAVNGVAAGSGFQLMQFCDYAVGHPGVRLGQTEVNSGMPSVLGTWLMWERIGNRAYELVLQGRLMGGEEAKQLGFINEIVEPAKVLEVALEAARRLAAQPQLAFRITKAANRQFEQERYAAALKLSVEANRQAFQSGAAQKQIREFLESRRARKASTQPR
ncbi:enoyl-CoA hydratase/carnithine racemase [Bradyrhizobium sp. IAR9]|uniref:enoyl-CoA hydratase/isomerase family protein n=1 Tax=Bradyrhizobium sp. IAR9 TaxID=2663841 RepID=UPI0015CD0518|nr:enoyl-CoA hydratase/isomerase family protein [Bradyrhizobium sp. IAR9]NYG45381.1 enoyl-CoA hydratase/carnithine racemase [Bradyrhizobium sp. IAR9]